MFYDRAKIYTKGGDGGSGEVAFRREKYVPAGGPSGGDGGRGGDVIIVADSGLRTLVDFKYRKHYQAQRGERGQGKNRHGKSAQDLVIKVPAGTVVKDADSGEVLADMVKDGQQVIVARGGRGGRGNARFSSAQHPAPSFAEKGEPGEERWLQLELKLLADVGLVGMPNAGKSTLIAHVSAARPKIAAYPFTTLVPNLGVVQVEDGLSFVIADIPGLIEGAHRGAGLGHDFLRHVERSRLLVHVLDIAATEGRDFIKDFHTIRSELSLYNEKLLERTTIIAANKMDLPGAEENLKRLFKELSGRYEIHPISAVTGKGISRLLQRIGVRLQELENESPGTAGEGFVVFNNGPRFEIVKKDGVFEVHGAEIEKHVAMTDLENEEAVRRLQRIFARIGVEQSLRKKGARTGDTIRIGKNEFYMV